MSERDKQQTDTPPSGDNKAHQSSDTLSDDNKVDPLSDLDRLRLSQDFADTVTCPKC